MAIPLGIYSTFVAGKTPMLTKSFSSLRFLASAFRPSPANLRTVRTVTVATATEPAKETKSPGIKGIMKPRRVSPEMQAFLGGVQEIPRTQVLKAIWAYIKERNLQDPENKKVIFCDERLKKIFPGKERIGFLEIAGLISPHILK